MDSQQHIINKQIIEFTLPSKDNARDIQESFSRVYKNFVLPAIERICNKYTRSDEVIRINKLELDIGDISIDKLFTEFPEKTEKILEDILAKEIYQARTEQINNINTIANEPDNINTSTKYINTDQANLEKLIHFLQSGIIPWYTSDKIKKNIFSLTENLLIKSPGKLKEALSKILKYDIPRKRLLFQFPVPLLKKIVKLINPESAGFIFECCHVIEQINHYQHIFKLSEQEIKYTIIDSGINFILVKKQNINLPSEKKQFICFICEHFNSYTEDKQNKKHGYVAVIKSIYEGINYLKTSKIITDKTTIEPVIFDLLSEYEKSTEIIDYKKEATITETEAEDELLSSPSDYDQADDDSENLASLKNKNTDDTVQSLKTVRHETEENNKTLASGKQGNRDNETGHKKTISDLTDENDTKESQLNEKEDIRKNHKNKATNKNIPEEKAREDTAFASTKSDPGKYQRPTGTDQKNILQTEKYPPENIDEKNKTGFKNKKTSEIENNIETEEKFVNHDKKNSFLFKRPQFISVDELYVNNAGIVLLWTFFNRFFTLLGLVKDKKFKDIEAAYRAVHILQCLAFQQEKTPEHELALNKLLCGLDIEEPLPVGITMSSFEKEESNNLLLAVIDNWKALKKTSVESLQTTFLQKEGILSKQSNGWKLIIERNTVDILLDRLPWGISVIALPWSKEIMYVEW